MGEIVAAAFWAPIGEGGSGEMDFKFLWGVCGRGESGCLSTGEGGKGDRGVEGQRQTCESNGEGGRGEMA